MLLRREKASTLGIPLGLLGHSPKRLANSPLVQLSLLWQQVNILAAATVLNSAKSIAATLSLFVIVLGACQEPRLVLFKQPVACMVLKAHFPPIIASLNKCVATCFGVCFPELLVVSDGGRRHFLTKRVHGDSLSPTNISPQAN